MCSKEEIINASCMLKNSTHQKYILLPIMWWNAINLYQIAGQLEIRQDQVLSDVSTLIGSVMKKKQADQTQVSPEKII